MKRLLLTTLFALALAPVGMARAETYVVAVSPTSPISDISAADLRRLFLSQEVSRGGKALVPMNLPADSPVRKAFDRLALAMSPSDAARFWNERKIRGEAGPPKEVANAGKAQLMAAKFPQVVVYLPAAELSPKLRLVSVDGKKPGDPGYLLKD